MTGEFQCDYQGCSRRAYRYFLYPSLNVIKKVCLKHSHAARSLLPQYKNRELTFEEVLVFQVMNW